MAITSTTLLLFFILVSLFLISHCQTCSNYTFSSNRVFSSCTKLPHLEAHIHWNYIPSTGNVEVAYRANQTSNGWVAWAINPTQPGMVGSQTIVAFQNANGTMSVYPTSITSYSPSMLPGALSFQVSNLSAEYSNKEMTIFANVGPLENGSAVNLLWQAGSSVLDNVPQVHSMSMPNLQSMGTLDFLSG